MTESLALDIEEKPKKSKKPEQHFRVDAERSELLKSLSHIQNVVEKRTSVPILSHIKLDAVDGILTIYATDMDLAVIEKLNAVVHSQSQIAISAHTLYEIVRKMPDQATITIEQDLNNNGQVNIFSGNISFTLSYLPANEFPVLDQKGFSHEFELPAKTLKEIIDKTKFAISTEETRYNLNGIYLHAHQEEGKSVLRAVATDCHRLALYEAELPKNAENMPGVIIPRKAILELRKLIDSEEANVSVSVTENKIRFVYGDIVFISKLIDGSFPDYNGVIPKENDKKVLTSTSTLANAIDRVSTITNEKFRSVRCAFAKGELEISANAGESGFASEKIEIDYSDKDVIIGFNYRYMLDVIAVVKTSNLELYLNDPYSPAIIKEEKNENALFVIMPMRYE